MRSEIGKINLDTVFMERDSLNVHIVGKITLLQSHMHPVQNFFKAIHQNKLFFVSEYGFFPMNNRKIVAKTDIPFSLQGIKWALCQSLTVLVSKLSCIFSSEDLFCLSKQCRP